MNPDTLTTINPNKALWEKGDFTQIAADHEGQRRGARQSAGHQRRARGSGPGMCDGTTALPAARRGANVLGVDIATNLVEAGNARVRSLGIANCRFQEGDASDLYDLEDDRFDLVISMFGAMFAPAPVRCGQGDGPGHAGRRSNRAWQLDRQRPDVRGAALKISASYLPPPPNGFVSPVSWGVEEHVTERFTAAGVPEDELSFENATYTFNFPGSPAEFLALFRKYYGPTMNAFEAAAASGRDSELQSEQEALGNDHNANGSEAPTSIPATYLRVSVSP
jgi:hypothetical protein